MQSADKPHASDIHKASGYDIRDDVHDIYGRLTRLGLAAHALELDIKGLTVIPPETVRAPGILERAREAFLKTYERRHGDRLDYRHAETLPAALGSPIGKHMAWMLLEDPVFSEILLNETLLAMVHYRLGVNATLSVMQGLVKAKGGLPLGLHTDEVLVPAPYASASGHLNVTYLLTDYSVENGALSYVPGSHKYKRLPVGDEGVDQAEAVVGVAGSFVVWDGATWHGALPRTATGLRLNLIYDFIRPHLRPMEVFFDRVDPADYEKYPPIYRTLLGQSLKYWWREEGPDFADVAWTRIGNSAFR